MTNTKEHPIDRAAKARKVRMRSAEEKKAAILRERGWICIPPEAVDRLDIP